MEKKLDGVATLVADPPSLKLRQYLLNQYGDLDAL